MFICSFELIILKSELGIKNHKNYEFATQIDSLCRAPYRIYDLRAKAFGSEAKFGL